MHSNNILIVGWGSQAKAWAMNLRDSGRNVLIALREDSPSHAEVKSKGFQTITLNKNKKIDEANVVCLLIPDDQQSRFLKKYANSFLPGTKIVYAHGYSVTKEKLNFIHSHLDHLLLAPKAIASELRWQYECNGKLGAAYSVEFSLNPEESSNIVLSLAKDLGITAGPYTSTFEQEMVADLFSEQTLLCSFLPVALRQSFDRLIAKGIPEEIAYLECWYEVKLIADTLIPLGPTKFFELISPNALLGGYKAQNILFDEAYQKKLDNLLSEISSGEFFDQIDQTEFNALRNSVIADWKESKLNKTHEKLKQDLYN